MVKAVIAISGVMPRLTLAMMAASASAAAASPWWTPHAGMSYNVQFTPTLDLAQPFSILEVDGLNVQANDIKTFKAGSTASTLSNGSTDKKVVCYLAAGDWEPWRTDASAFSTDLLGNTITGTNGERYLDIRQLDKVTPVLQKRAQAAKDKGCDALDWDYVNLAPDALILRNQTSSLKSDQTGFDITDAHSLAFAHNLATMTHSLGMAAAIRDAGLLSETISQASSDASADAFDFAVAEDCATFSECDTYLPFVANAKPVFAIEYVQALPSGDEYCKSLSSFGFDAIIKETPSNVLTAGQPSSVASGGLSNKALACNYNKFYDGSKLLDVTGAGSSTSSNSGSPSPSSAREPDAPVTGQSRISGLGGIIGAFVIVLGVAGLA